MEIKEHPLKMDNKKNHSTINNENRSNNTDELKHDSNRSNGHIEIRDLEILKKRHRCNACNRTFAKMVDLKYHLMRHIGIRDYICRMCNKRFVRSDTLKTHMRVHTGEKPHHCHLCEKRFTQKINLAKHLKVHTKEQLYQQKSNDSNNNVAIGIVEDHMQIHDEIDQSCCTNKEESIRIAADPMKIQHDNCNKPIDDEHDNFNDPIRDDEEFQMNNEIINENSEINKLSNDSIIKEEVIEIEEHPLKIEESIENERLAQMSVFVKGAKQMIQHSLKTVLKKSIDQNCPNLNLSSGDGECMVVNQNETNRSEQCLNDKTNLTENSHCPNEENNQNRIVPGTDYDKHTNSCVTTKKLQENVSGGCIIREYLKKHLQNNITGNVEAANLSIEDQMYVCEIHGKQFSQNCYLKHYLEQYNVTKLYHCKVCDKQFSTVDKLKRHLNCGRTFSHNYRLQTHLLIHSDEKLYHCEICERQFRSMELLKRHSKMHIRNGLYLCNNCGEYFLQKNCLKTHLRIHSKNDDNTETTKTTNTHPQYEEQSKELSTNYHLYQCETCYKPFPRERLLRQHMLFVHNVQQPYKCDRRLLTKRQRSSHSMGKL